MHLLDGLLELDVGLTCRSFESVEVGDGYAKLMDEQRRDLDCRRIEVDEIWAYVGKKQRHMTASDDPSRVGDQYTFVALDPVSKLVPAYLLGKRDLPTATAFMADLGRAAGEPCAAIERRACGLCRCDRAGFRRRDRLSQSGAVATARRMLSEPRSRSFLAGRIAAISRRA